MPTPKQLIEQSTRHAAQLERLKSGDVLAFRQFLQEMQQAVVAQLAGKEVVGFTRKQLKTQLSAVRAALQTSFDGYHEVWREQVVALADYIAGFEKRSIENVVAVNMSLPSAQQLTTAVFSNPLSVEGADGGKLLDAFYADWTTTEVNRVTGQIRMGAAQGKTTSEIIAAINGTAALGQTDGALALTERAMAAMTRTALQHAAAQAREATWNANDDIVTGVRWVSTLDSRTTAQCFTASTIVSFLGALKNVFRANYSGDIFIIATSAGKKIEGTPNHPILTTRGFLPLNEVQPGDKIVNATFDNGTMVQGDENVSVPTCIGKLFDAVNEKPGFNVFRERASAVDFYGDGKFIDGEIDIVTAEGELRSDVISDVGQLITNELFRSIKRASRLTSFRGLNDPFFRNWLSKVSAKINAMFVEHSIDHTFTSPEFSCNIDGLQSLLEQFDSPETISSDVFITVAALQMLHDAILFQKACDGGCCDAIIPGNLCGCDAASVKCDDVVSVVTEFRNCHVYTLSCCPGVYTAEGFIVKNCAALDGQVFPLRSGPRPPIHVGCRSTTVAELAPGLRILDAGGTRASRDVSVGPDGKPVDGPSVIGETPAKTRYYTWLRSQPADVQNSIIGPTRGKLLRDGGLTAQRFAELQLNKNFTPLKTIEIGGKKYTPLEQMRRMEPIAFSKAGL